MPGQVGGGGCVCVCVGGVCVNYPIVQYAGYTLRTQLRQNYLQMVKSPCNNAYRPFSYCIDYLRSERVGPFTKICQPDFWSANSD